MKGLLGVTLFFGGAAVGFLAANALLKSKYEEIANEEIQSVKEYYKGVDERDGQMPEEVEMVEEVTEKEVTNIESYGDEEEKEVTLDEDDEEEEISRIYRSDYEATDEFIESLKKDEPYLIPQEKFGEGIFDYELETLYYYTDGILADQGDEIIRDLEPILGSIDLERFDEYDEDDIGFIYIRNDARKYDYEIQKENVTFEDNLAGVGWGL